MHLLSSAQNETPLHGVEPLQAALTPLAGQDLVKKLIDLHSDGEPVSWPPGWSLLLAKQYVGDVYPSGVAATLRAEPFEFNARTSVRIRSDSSGSD